MKRWWERLGGQITLTVLVIGTGFLFYRTQSALISDLYGRFVIPFMGEPPSPEELRNAKIEELQGRLEALQQENQQLKSLLKYQEDDNRKDLIAAPVIGRSADHWWKQITLGKGSEDGVKVGYVVVGVGGLVGRVISVTPQTCKVLLISDPSSQVGSIVNRTRDMGFMQGQGHDLAVMQFFEKVPNMKVGDVIVTSTVSQLYPQGIPIGKVKGMRVTNGPAPSAEIELFAPLESLEWVIIQPFKPKFR